MSQPRYRQLADILRGEIVSGRYPVGSQLPPEFELCQLYDVSRHTARDALRLLFEAGLVERRRGVGTTVIRDHSAPAFVQPLGGTQALMQYARDARLQIRTAGLRRLEPQEAIRIGLNEQAADAWLVASGLRRNDGKPVALSQIYIAPAYAEIAPKLRDWDGAIQQLIARDFGVVVHRIEQEISAVNLTAEQARFLKAEKGGAALHTLRRYFDADGRLMLASDSTHPASRFVYAMTYHRES
ncbi:MAG: GntR family transcriptional regulator [Brevundimonas sp.]|uniref:GntR family transcriptional regulator n=1 Tax=Brevundimonas sp. TaxID=1871086 RepID=UPI0025B9FCAB|nr:GntR family transcriptional regulator [Brevundimonas sp.]MBX3478468.1 GntR family transcriptional regulator [Brevundimonas sp.]